MNSMVQSYDTNSINIYTGLPFFIRMPRSIGNSVYIWTQSTKDSNFFITHFELAHPDPTNELLYKEPQMRKKHFELIG